jgi:hypothetical protein
MFRIRIHNTGEYLDLKMKKKPSIFLPANYSFWFLGQKGLDLVPHSAKACS